MSSILDERISALRVSQKAESENRVRRKGQLDDQLAALEGRAQAFDSRLEHLEHAGQQVERNVEDAAAKARKFYRVSVVGLVVLTAVGATMVLIAHGIASHIREEARSAATNIRLQNAELIELTRREGEESLDALQQQIAERRAEMEGQIGDIGADLAELIQERNEIRGDLERFAELQERIGFELVDYRGRPVIVAPKGLEIRGWRAPGLSNLARFNGQMFRFTDAVE